MRKIITLLILSLFLIQCSSEEERRIGKNQIGKINNNTKVSELDVIFKSDSILKLPEGADEFNEYKIFNEEGKHLLTFKPKVNDSLHTLERVQVYDDSYSTEKGISTSSTFIDVVNNYTINKIEPTFNSALLFVDEINITIALDKKDLNLDEFDMRKINEGQIPDMAKIKFITVWFE